VITVFAHAGGDETETLLEGLAVLAILVPYALAVALGALKNYERKGRRPGQGGELLRLTARPPNDKGSEQARLPPQPRPASDG